MLDAFERFALPVTSALPPPADRRFRKPERLLKRADFLTVQGGGQKLVTRHFLWFTRPRDLGLRLGITVSKRVGPAVTRNRVKRLLREAFRHHKGLFPQALDVVVVAKAEAGSVLSAEVLSQVRDCARRLTAMNKPGHAATK